MVLHIMPPNMVHDEGERVQERKNKEGIRNPSVEDLKPLVRDSRKQRDPVRLSCGCTDSISILKAIPHLIHVQYKWHTGQAHPPRSGSKCR